MTDQQKEKIFRTYHEKIFGYLRDRTGDVPTAEDLTMDVFVKVYEKSGTFDETKASLSTWIYTITRNTLTDYFRTRRDFSEIPESEDDGESIEDDFSRTEMLESLAAALEALDRRERDIIILHYYSGRTLKKISAEMGISYAYLKTLHGKALEKLKNLLKNSSLF